MQAHNVHFCHVRVDRNQPENRHRKDYTFAFRFTDTAVQVGFAFCTLGSKSHKPDNFCRATGRDVATQQMLKCDLKNQTSGHSSARFATIQFSKIPSAGIPTPKEVRAYVTANILDVAGTR
jgi:hypothetical protein